MLHNIIRQQQRLFLASVNDGDSSKVQKDQKEQLADDASSEVPMEDTDAVKSPSNRSNERKVPQCCQRIVSKAAVESIGKIAQSKQKNSKISLPDNHNIDDDESSALNQLAK